MYSDRAYTNVDIARVEAFLCWLGIVKPSPEATKLFEDRQAASSLTMMCVATTDTEGSRTQNVMQAECEAFPQVQSGKEGLGYSAALSSQQETAHPVQQETAHSAQQVTAHPAQQEAAHPVQQEAAHCAQQGAAHPSQETSLASALLSQQGTAVSPAVPLAAGACSTSTAMEDTAEDMRLARLGELATELLLAMKARDTARLQELMAERKALHAQVPP